MGLLLYSTTLIGYPAWTSFLFGKLSRASKVYVKFDVTYSMGVYSMTSLSWMTPGELKKKRVLVWPHIQYYELMRTKNIFCDCFCLLGTHKQWWGIFPKSEKCFLETSTNFHSCVTWTSNLRQLRTPDIIRIGATTVLVSQFIICDVSFVNWPQRGTWLLSILCQWGVTLLPAHW